MMAVGWEKIQASQPDQNQVNEKSGQSDRDYHPFPGVARLLGDQALSKSIANGGQKRRIWAGA